MASFTLAVDRPFTNQDGNRETDFINIVVWNKQGENCAQYLAKGRLAAVDGRLQIRSYDGNDGQRRYVTEVIADNVRFLSSRNENGGGYDNSYGGNSGARGANNYEPPSPSVAAASFEDNMPLTSDDLPF